MPQFDTDVPNVEILFHCPFEGESVAQKVPDKTKEIIMKQDSLQRTTNALAVSEGKRDKELIGLAW